MLIAATIMPIVFGLLEIPRRSRTGCRLSRVPARRSERFLPSRSGSGAPGVCGRLWAPVIGIAAGCSAAALSHFDLTRVAAGAVVRRSGPSLAGLRSRVQPVVSGACCPRSCSSRSSAPWKRSAMGLPSSRARGARAGRQTSGAVQGAVAADGIVQPAFRTLGDGAQHDRFQ